MQGVAIKLANLPRVVREKLYSLGKHLETTIDGVPCVIVGIEVFNNKSLIINRVAVDTAAKDDSNTKILEHIRYRIERVAIFTSYTSAIAPSLSFAGKIDIG